jgi:hypothetical protein
MKISWSRSLERGTSAKRRRWSASTERKKAKPTGEPNLTG